MTMKQIAEIHPLDIIFGVIHMLVAVFAFFAYFTDFQPTSFILFSVGPYALAAALISFGISPYRRVEDVEVETECEDKTEAVTKILRNPAYSKSTRVEAGLDLTQSPRYPYTIKGEIARKNK